jgi:hypothetical protein
MSSELHFEVLRRTSKRRPTNPKNVRLTTVRRWQVDVSSFRSVWYGEATYVNFSKKYPYNSSKRGWKDADRPASPT